MLEYVNDNNNNIKASSKFILIISTLLLVMFLIIGYLDKSLSKESLLFNITLFFGINIIALFFYVILFCMNLYLKNANNKIMKMGKKSKDIYFQQGKCLITKQDLYQKITY